MEDDEQLTQGGLNARDERLRAKRKYGKMQQLPPPAELADPFARMRTNGNLQRNTELHASEFPAPENGPLASLDNDRPLSYATDVVRMTEPPLEQEGKSLPFAFAPSSQQTPFVPGNAGTDASQLAISKRNSTASTGNGSVMPRPTVVVRKPQPSLEQEDDSLFFPNAPANSRRSTATRPSRLNADSSLNLTERNIVPPDEPEIRIVKPAKWEDTLDSIARRRAQNERKKKAQAAWLGMLEARTRDQAIDQENERNTPAVFKDTSELYKLDYEEALNDIARVLEDPRMAPGALRQLDRVRQGKIDREFERLLAHGYSKNEILDALRDQHDLILEIGEGRREN